MPMIWDFMGLMWHHCNVLNTRSNVGEFWCIAVSRSGCPFIQNTDLFYHSLAPNCGIFYSVITRTDCMTRMRFYMNITVWDVFIFRGMKNYRQYGHRRPSTILISGTSHRKWPAVNRKHSIAGYSMDIKTKRREWKSLRFTDKRCVS